MGESSLQIAIIDDGVNEKRYGSIGNLEYNMEVHADLTISEREDYNAHLYSHGTTCAAIIKKYAENAVLSSVKILDSHTQSCLKAQLIEAIKWCVNKKIKIIHLSLGTTYFKDFDDVSQAVEFACSKGAIIVATCSNKNKYTCPASLDCVIGVKTDGKGLLQEGEYICNPVPPDGIDITSCSSHSLRNHSGELELSQVSNSFAAPMITAFAYQALCEDAEMSVDQIKLQLAKKSLSIKPEGKYQENRFLDDDLDIPIIMICGQMHDAVFERVESMKKLLHRDGYHAITAMAPRLNVESLKTIRSVHEPDILILGQVLKKGERIEENINSDITIAIEPELPVGKDLVGTCEKLIVISDSPMCNDFGQCKVFRKHKAESLYKYIVQLFEA